MTYRTPLIDFLRAIVESMEFPVVIKSVVEVAGVFTIVVDDVYHAQATYTMEIGGNDYVITSVDDETNTIVATGSASITVTEFEMYAVHFYHGTPIEANTEIDKTATRFDGKTPMVFVMESFTEDYDDDIESIIERKVSPRIFCLTSADFDKWTTANFQTHAIRPMSRLVDNLREKIRTTRRVDYENAASHTTTHYRFGVYITNKGTEKSLFVDKLSGQEFVADLTLYKLQNRSCDR